ncbi:transglycosylase SLT domain-containing protein [candidate division CSSED10-310 bacterium]|uniref:Transglycosylase SLT domain-containing protein n=1 Tax=candidate division CSSED10-310 bacterium TaxID=2855610 RepID=A0ABV6YZ07_UNCC1
MPSFLKIKAGALSVIYLVTMSVVCPIACAGETITQERSLQTPVLFQKALDQIEKQNIKDAIPVLRSYLQTAPASDQIWLFRTKFLLAYALFKTGKKDESLPFWEVLATSSYVLNDFCWLKKGEILDNNGDQGKAALWFEQFAGRFPTSDLTSQARIRASQLYSDLNNFQKILDLLENSGGDSDSPKRILLLATAKFNLSREKEAGLLLRKIMTDHPLSPEADKADALLLKLISQTGYTALALTVPERETRLKTFVRNKHYKDAVSEAKILLKLVTTPDRSDNISFLLAKSLYHRYKLTEAGRIFSRLSSTRDPELKPLVFMYLGLIGYRRGNLKTALSHLDSLLVKDFVHHKASYELGAYLVSGLLDEADYKKALHVFEKIPLSCVPGAEEAHFYWLQGWLSFLNARYRAALQSFQHLQENYPRSSYHPQAIFWSAKTFYLLGELDQACHQFQILQQEIPVTYYAARSHAYRQQVCPGIPAKQKRTKVWQQIDITRKFTTSEPAQTNQRAEEFELLKLYSLVIEELQAQSETQGSQLARSWKIATLLEKQQNFWQSIPRFRSIYQQMLAMEPDFYSPSLLKRIYPLKYDKSILIEAKRSGNDPYLLLAIIHQESCFSPAACSRAGAIGLMQIMPKVGKWLAKRYKIRNFRTSWLRNPDLNIRLGAYQVKWLKNLFDDDLLLIIAAYNAGRTTLLRWQKKYQVQDPDVLVELMPYAETKNFVKRVVRNYLQYQLLYEKFGR